MRAWTRAAAGLILVASGAAPLRAGEAAIPKPDLPAKWEAAEHDPVAWLKKCRDAYDAIKGYECTLLRRQRIEDELGEWKWSVLKFRKPLAARVRVVGGEKAGTDLLYVAGANNGKIRARSTGLLGIAAFNVAPDSRRAMKGELYPITWIGIGKVLDLMDEEVRKVSAEGRLVATSFEATHRGRKYLRFDVVLPKDGEGKYFCRRAQIEIDAQVALPVHIVLYDWQERLREEYYYLDLILDPEFDAATFDFDDI